jgi:NAD(P)-dependent dehydrogenase (short-subunit alcohol dehydrogenase family)
VLEVNVTGAFHLVKHALPHLRAQAAGAIVVVSSIQASSRRRRSRPTAPAKEGFGRLLGADASAGTGGTTRRGRRGDRLSGE